MATIVLPMKCLLGEHRGLEMEEEKQVQSHRPTNGYPGLSRSDEDLPQSRIDLDYLHASGHPGGCVF